MNINLTAVRDEHEELASLAAKIKFTDVIPTIPTPYGDSRDWNFFSRVAGFASRYFNWKHKLKHYISSNCSEYLSHYSSVTL